MLAEWRQLRECLAQRCVAPGPEQLLGCYPGLLARDVRGFRRRPARAAGARTGEGVDRGFAQNFLGAFLLTRLLEERLLARASACRGACGVGAHGWCPVHGRAAPSRVVAYQGEDRLTFSTNWPGCGASMIMLLPM